MLEQQKYRRAEPILSDLEIEYRNCTRWAVIVGISQYEYERWNLKYAARDADKFYELLLTPYGGRFEKERICKLTNKEATTGKITQALRSFLQKPAKEDVVLLYFACHGSSDPNRPQNLYLLTYDTNPDDIAGTALPMEDIHRSIEKNLLAEKVIILADTCHSGGMMSQGRRSPIDDSQLMNQYLNDLRQAAPGIATFTSAESRQVAQEGEQWGGGHGVFTYYLLEGMQGKADKDNNQIVTIGELFEYVRDRVKQDTNDKQHPSIGGGFDRNLPIAIASSLISKQYFEEGLELYRDGKLNEAISRMNEAVRLNPKNGWYHLRLGDMLYKQDKMNEAIAAYQKGFDLGAKDAAVYCHVGFIFYTLNRFDEAINACKQAISLDSQLIEPYIWLGAALHQQGKLEEAILIYKQAISINTNSFEAHLRLGKVLFEQKKFDEAFTSFKKASQIDPNQPGVWCQLGIVLYEKGDNVLAVENLEKAISLFIKDNQQAQAEKVKSFISEIQAEKTT